MTFNSSDIAFSKLGFLARFTKQENGISIIQDLHVFVNHQFRFIL